MNSINSYQLFYPDQKVNDPPSPFQVHTYSKDDIITRVDYIWVQNYPKCFIIQIFNYPITKSDHSLIGVHINLTEFISNFRSHTKFIKLPYQEDTAKATITIDYHKIKKD